MFSQACVKNSVRRGCAWQEASMAGGAWMAEGHAWQGGMCGRRDGHCSRCYASYWNAFLLLSVTASPTETLYYSEKIFRFFVGLLIPLFWISGDVCSGFQSKGGSFSLCFLAWAQWIPQFHLWCGTC